MNAHSEKSPLCSAEDRLEGPQGTDENQAGDDALVQGVPARWGGTESVIGGGGGT